MEKNRRYEKHKEKSYHWMKRGLKRRYKIEKEKKKSRTIDWHRNQNEMSNGGKNTAEIGEY